jgi:hypothetical protein
VSLCHECHGLQHRIGETTFWKMQNMTDVETLIDAFCKASPKAMEIRIARHG